MKTINMGLNTEPYWVRADEVIERWKANKNSTMVECWEKMRNDSLELRNKIIETVEAEGSCGLNWTCTGETLFNILANQWSSAMPQYRFEISRYTCKVYQK